MRASRASRWVRAGWRPLWAALLAFGCDAAAPPTTPGAGTLAVVLEQKDYAQGAVLAATVRNGLGAAIYAEDSKSDCSILIVERQDGQAWRSITGCSVERIAAVVTIPAGAAYPVRIDPSSIRFGAAAAGRPVLADGTYRLRLNYRKQPGLSGGEPETVTSETFTIRP